MSERVRQRKGKIVEPVNRPEEESEEPLQSQKRKTKLTSDRSNGAGRRWVGVLKYLLLIILIPPFLNYASLQREQRQLMPEEGQMYDIGWGQKLFLLCQGKGPPTVILDAPTGMSSDVWSLVWPKIAKHTRVCIYDRAGLGFSDRPLENKTDVSQTPTTHWQSYTAERMVDDMHRLLTLSSQQPQPFILVGAELGGLVAEFYSQIYESSILGLILVNPLADDLFEQDGGVWAQYWFGQLVPTYQSLQLGAALGLTRLALLFGLLKHPLSSATSLPEDVERRQKHLMCHPRHLSTVVDEHHFINETFSQMRTMRIIKSLPSNITVTMVTGNYYDEQMPNILNKAWAKSEQALITRYLPSGQQIVVNGADHHMLYKNPSAIVEPVLKIVKQWQQLRKKKIAKNH